jgi:uncharacterized protein (DUF1778 family)
MAKNSTQIEPGRSPKDGRIAVRASREERELIAQASRASATTVSSFVLRASIARAADVLAERREFRLLPDQWDAFVAMLDRPAVAKPRLRQLLTEPSVLDR